MKDTSTAESKRSNQTVIYCGMKTFTGIEHLSADVNKTVEPRGEQLKRTNQPIFSAETASDEKALGWFWTGSIESAMAKETDFHAFNRPVGS